MMIRSCRRGGARNLSDHLRRTDENESVKVHDLEGFPFKAMNGPNLENALMQMQAIGYGKGDKRNLYHVIIAPAYGETLNAAQRKFMVDYYAGHMGFKGHQCAVVEHWKKGKQHFHLVFNIIDPATGKTHELKWSKNREWRISRGLEQIFGLSTPKPKGKAQPVWAVQRGKRTGINPVKMRKDITAIFHASRTAKEFIAALDKVGFALTKGRRNQLVLVDRAGDTHGLMRMIEGQKLADLRRKFPGIEKLPCPPHETLVRLRKSKGTGKETPPQPIDQKRVKADVLAAHAASATGAELFVRLNRKGYALGRGLKGFAVIDRDGGRHDLKKLLGKELAKGLYRKFPDLAAIRPSPVIELIRRMRAGQPSRVTRHPLRHMGYHFNRAARALTWPAYWPRPALRPQPYSGMAALILHLAAIARRRAARNETKETAQNWFPATRRRKRRRGDQNIPDSEKMPFRRPEWETAEHLAWAWETHRADVLALYGIYLAPDPAMNPDPPGLEPG